MPDNFEVQASDLLVNPEPQVPIILCLDVSASMRKDKKLDELNEGIRLFIDTVKKDPVANSSVELCVITFADDAQLLADFRELAYFQFDPLEITGGMTNIGAGVNLALDCLEKRKSVYKHVGIDYFQPWLVLMTDGLPNVGRFHIDAAKRTCQLEAEKKLVVFPIGIGADAGIAELAKFSNKRPPLKLIDVNFRGFFDWLSKTVSHVSRSTPGKQIIIDTDSINNWGTL